MAIILNVPSTAKTSNLQEELSLLGIKYSVKKLDANLAIEMIDRYTTPENPTTVILARLN